MRQLSMNEQKQIIGGGYTVWYTKPSWSRSKCAGYFTNVNAAHQCAEGLRSQGYDSMVVTEAY